jgi:uncharacterized membrane protein
MVILPITATLYFVYWLGASVENGMRHVIGWVMPNYTPSPGVGIVVGVLLVLIVGLVMQAWLFRKLFHIAESMLDRVPLVKSLYGGVKDLLSMFQGSKTGDGQVVLIYWQGLELLGMVTREDFQDVSKALASDNRIAVYIPMSYAIGGYTIFVPRDKMAPIDMTVEDAMRFAITAGVTADSDED